MKWAYVDTNILLRFITGAPKEQALQAKRLFAAAEQGETRLIIDEIVVAEAVWVLTSFYKFSKEQVSEVLIPILAAPGIEMFDKNGVLLALTLYAQQNVDFVDALLSVHMQRAGVPDLISYDRHFDRLPGVRRWPPEAWLGEG